MQLIVRGNQLSGSISSVESVNYYDPGGARLPSTLNLTIDLHPSLGTGLIGNGDDMVPTVIEAHRINRITARSLEADIITIGGQGIGELNIDGDIGSSTYEVTLDTDGDIEDIQAKNIYADIDAGGNVESIQVFGSGGAMTEATDAVFEGSLDCVTMNLGAGLRIWGDLDADVNIADAMIGATDPANNITRIAIGDDLNGNITIGSGGMNRGITIGWMESATGAWNGTIEVDIETLSPDYTQVVTGGGAVGLAPYGAHFFECDPAYTVSGPGEVTVPGASTTANITITHYGYVKYTGGGTPYVVYESPGSHCTSGCSAEFFSNKTSEWSTVSIGATASLRSMKLQGTARDGMHYHIDVNGTLECRDVFGEPSTAKTKPYWYIFNTN
jgi:hypothetical protein